MDIIAARTPPRGPYTRIPLSVKLRVVEAFQNDEDWKAVASTNGIKQSTARNWLYQESPTPKQRGGYRPCLLTSAMVDTIQGWVESGPHMTLQEVKDRVQIELGAQVSTTALHRELDKRVFTYNDDEPVQANDVTQKRQDYVRAFRALSRQGKIPIWMGKKTFNLFSSRVTKKARAKREKRPSAGSTRGNVHVFGAMSTSNFVYCEHKRGEYKYADANQSLERMLRAARAHYGRLDDIVVIADNAPWYSRIANVFEEDEFSAATVLRLGTYSSMLNPIEHLWAEVSAHIKTLVRERLEVFMGLPPHGLTRHEFRILFLEHIVEQVLDGVDTTRLPRYALRLECFYDRAEAMDDM
ncbi:hypothetical protein AaE_009572 [Aphanomyces astaci]|uniref:Tc1-like transposase DDE domain-containing protein n=1 Tax=Aphanomyces astaci TaxID=112090 RepID=A0A6A5A2N0_APHAT|nr:hypothetical protein AaE_009572 [Aphanomyces astaci]